MNTTEKRRADTVLRCLAALQKMSEAELREQWQILFGNEPPAYRHPMLVRRLAYRIQELAFGGDRESLSNRIAEVRVKLGLDELACASSRAKRMKDAPPLGTRFVREWSGVRYVVTVTGEGYEFQGRTHRSLTAIAKLITGTHWNGRAFFGLAKGTSKQERNSLCRE